MMGPLKMKAFIAVVLCGSFMFTEIQGSADQNSFPLKQRFNPFLWGSPLSLMDFFRCRFHGITGWRDPIARDAFMRQWYHIGDDASRYGVNNCRNRGHGDYQTPKMVANSEQNQKETLLNQKSSDWNTPERNQQFSTSNNQRSQEQSGNSQRNPSNSFGQHWNTKHQENNVKRNNQHRRFQEKEPSQEFQRQPKITSPPLENHHPRPSSPSQPPKMVEIATLDVSGYYPDEITVEVKDKGQMIIKGLHVCDCKESCFEKEFQRRVAIPKRTNEKLLKAVFTPDSKLKIFGHHDRDANSSNFRTPFYISVESDESLRNSNQRNTDPTCGGQKRGIKLKQMDSKSKQIIEDHPEMRTEKKFEGEVDEDGVTIETDEY